MKSKIVISVAVFLFLGTGFGVLSFAQGMPGMQGDASMKQKGMMMESDGRSSGKMRIHPMAGMMKGMMGKTLVATNDGGVVLLIGNKLMKYDKDLNLIKEVDIKIDMAAMQKNMRDMMKDCPMMGKGMMDPGMEQDEGKEMPQSASDVEKAK